MPSARVSLSLLAVALGCASASSDPAEFAEYRQVLMGMEVRIAINAARPQADSLADRAFARIAELEAMLSDWNPQSELRRLELAPVGDWTTVSGPLRDVLALALTLARETDGAFDPTVGALTALWRESVRSGQPIADSARSRALRSVGYENLELDSASSRLRFTRAGTRLDLGAIAKGWILDQAILTLSTAEAAGVLIEAGGDIVTWGAPSTGEGWRVAVRTRDGDSTLVVREAAISTSSAAAQLSRPTGTEAEGHIFRTSDGRGATDTPQITVVGRRGAVTDALATALPLLPRTRWGDLAARYGVQVIEGPPPDRR
jgi:thiamine biosynthesis lipoprotein